MFRTLKEAYEYGKKQGWTSFIIRQNEDDTCCAYPSTIKKGTNLTINDYDELAQRTSNNDLSPKDHLLNGIIGMSGEANEALEIMKKHLFQGHPLGAEKLKHIASEIGDCLWYTAEATRGLRDMMEQNGCAGYTLLDVALENIEKLKNRYPDAFDPDRSINRAKGDI